MPESYDDIKKDIDKGSEVWPPVVDVAVVFRVQHYEKNPKAGKIRDLLVNHLRLEQQDEVLRNVKDVHGQIKGHVLAVRGFGEPL